jgi:hypothetical protein
MHFNALLYKKTPTIIVRSKSYQRKQIVAFLLHVIMGLGVALKVHLTKLISFGFVMMTSIVMLEIKKGSMQWIDCFTYNMACATRD